MTKRQWASIMAVLGMLVGIWLRFGPGKPSQAMARNGSPAGIPLKWEFDAQQGILGALALADDGTLYAASQDGFVYALDPSGAVVWKFYGGPMTSALAISPDGGIIASNIRGRVFALNRNGSQRWETDTYDGNTWQKSGAALDHNFLYAPTRDGLCEIQLSQGNLLWKAGLGAEQNGSVTILPSGLIAFPGRGRLNIVDSRGAMQWQYPPLSDQQVKNNGGFPPPGNTSFMSGIAVGTDGKLYAGTANLQFMAFSADGNVAWQFKTGYANRATPVIASDGTIYFAGGDGFVHARNSDGSEKWVYQAHDGIVATPIIAEDGTIYVVDVNDLLALSSDGKLLSTTRLSNSSEASPTLAPDGTIYIATVGGKILAFAGDHGGLMKSPWPKYQRDLSNTGHTDPF